MFMDEVIASRSNEAIGTFLYTDSAFKGLFIFEKTEGNNHF